MKASEQDKRRDRRDWLIILILLLLGFLCILLTSGWALRFSPSWRLDTNMESRLDPNSDFLTFKPSGFFEPVDPSILTQPVWMNVFLTPGASFATRTPAPPPTSVNTTPSAKPPTLQPTNTIIPTSTYIYFPPTSKPSTSVPPTSIPPTSPPSTISVDLQITKNDGGATTYTAGSTVNYTITVTNNGPNSVTGAIVTDVFSTNANIDSATWNCAGAGGATCNTASGSGDINASNGGVVNLPVSSSVTYTVTANINAGATGDLVNTASVAVPSGYTDTNTGNNSATDTDTLSVSTSADLQVTMDDGGRLVYKAGDTIDYTITVLNNGPDDVTGATLSDNKPSQVDTWGWCVAPCTPVANSSTTLSDTINLTSGASITYTITANISANPGGNLTNTATISSSNDPTPGNDFDTSTIQLAVSSYGNFGTGQSGPPIETFPAGSSIILTLSSPVTKGNGSVIIYYEQGQGQGIFMDQVLLEISDGFSWYTILNWGDGASNPGTNIDIPLPAGNPTDCSTEPDNCTIDNSVVLLVGGTGVTMDIDSMPWIPAGTYQYFRITTPSGDPDGTGADGIEVVP